MPAEVGINQEKIMEGVKNIGTGKYQEVHELSEKFPEIVPFLPLKFLVFAENDETVFIALNPAMLAEYYSSPELKLQLMRWKNDIESVMNELREYQYQPVSDS